MNTLNQHNRIDLKIGEVYIAKAPEIIWTVLGSCVAVVLYNQRLKIGAICHAQLPAQKHKGFKCSDACPVKCLTHVPESKEFKYVTCSIRYLLKKLSELGISKSDTIVKLFGGANVVYSE